MLDDAGFLGHGRFAARRPTRKGGSNECLEISVRHQVIYDDSLVTDYLRDLLGQLLDGPADGVVLVRRIVTVYLECDP